MSTVRASVFVAALLCATVSCAIARNHGRDTSDVVGLAIIHRHGARLPQPGSNATAICGTLCGQLTSAGADMLYSLGQHVQRDYRNLRFHDEAMIPVIGTHYNPDLVVSFSSPVDRTIQSSQAFVRGLMAPIGTNLSASTVMPVTHSTSVADATLMLPSQVLINRLLISVDGLRPWIREDLIAFAKSKFTVDEMHVLGRLVQQEGACVNDTHILSCLLDAEDYIASGNANGVPIAAEAQAMYPRLVELLEKSNHLNFFAWNASDTFDKMAGKKGFGLANDIVQLFQGATAATTPENPLIKEYSGHDVSLMPFSEAIGNYSLTNPLFAGTFLVELRGTAPNFTVRVRYGEPDQAFGSDHKYHFFSVGLKCINATTGQEYDAPRDEGCPLADWAGFIAAGGPMSPSGNCYLTVNDMNAMDCLPGNSTTDARDLDPNPYCGFYRTNCPLWACTQPGSQTNVPPAFYLTPTFRCKPVGG
jgi:hypothetical protein